MKKILHSSLLLLACGALFVACQKDEKTVDLTAVIADQPTGNTKVYVEENTGYWQQGDVVVVRSGESNTDHYTLSVSSSGSHTAIIPGVTENSPYTAGYPYGNVVISGDGALSVTLPDAQTYTPAAIYEGGASRQRIVCPMAAYSADGSALQFHNVGSVLKVVINNEYTDKDLSIYAVEVESDNAPLAGVASVNVNASAATISGAITSPKTKVTLSVNGAIAVNSNTKDTVYIPILPIPESAKSKLTIHVMATEGAAKHTFHGESRTAVYIEPNQVGAVPVNLSAANDSINNYFWGQGTEDCPFLIENQTDLENLRTVTNAGTDGYCSGKYYKQTADITLSSWTTAIGNSSLKVFAAHYDGNGHSITNMNNACGLFAYAGGGSIDNLTVGGTVTLTSGQDFGGIVCKVTAGESMQACTNSVAISFSPGSNINLNAYGIGGCVGHATAKVTLNNCANENDIKITSSAETNSSLGGILGKNEGASSEIKNCTNNGIVGNTSTSSGSSGAFGGICGNTTAKVSIEGCENNGFMPWKPRNSSSYNSYLGGILGKAESGVEVNIKTCTNNARLKSYEAQYCYFGGIIGYVASTAGTVSIEDCTNIGGISLPNVGYTYAGGMIAYMNAGGTLTIKNCTNGDKDNLNDTSIYSQVSSAGMCAYSASATTIEACSNYSKIQSQTQGGGIIGRSITAGLTLKGHIINKGSIAATNTTAITQCGGIAGYVEYKITVDENALVENYGTITGGDNLGGIVSRLSLSQDSYIRRCINYGTVTASASKSYGNSGLIGDIRCASSTNGITIQDCGNENNVSAAGMAGGIVGHIYSNGVVRCTIQNCYCDANLYGGAQTGGIFTTAKNSSNALHIITSNCYYNGNLSGYSGRVGSLARITSTAPTTFKFSYCYADATSTPTPRTAEPTSGSSTTTYQAARTFTAPTGAYANKGASISENEWRTGKTLLGQLDSVAEADGFARWTQHINEETGIADELPRLVLSASKTSKKRR